MASGGYKCSTCGQAHGGVPDLGFKRPDAVKELDPQLRARCRENDDACMIPAFTAVSRERFFLRAVLEIPLIDGPGDPPQRCFGFGPWAEVDKQGHDAVAGQREGEDVAPFDGCLATSLPGFAGSLGLRVRVEPGRADQRPLLRVVDDSHQLAIAQRVGLSTHAVLEILRPFMP